MLTTEVVQNHSKTSTTLFCALYILNILRDVWGRSCLSHQCPLGRKESHQINKSNQSVSDIVGNLVGGFGYTLTTLIEASNSLHQRTSKLTKQSDASTSKVPMLDILVVPGSWLNSSRQEHFACTPAVSSPCWLIPIAMRNAHACCPLTSNGACLVEYGGRHRVGRSRDSCQPGTRAWTVMAAQEAWPQKYLNCMDSSTHNKDAALALLTITKLSLSGGGMFCFNKSCAQSASTMDVRDDRQHAAWMGEACAASTDHAHRKQLPRI
eukprot:1156462-Pelagomonas_calceolata.AAC.3